MSKGISEIEWPEEQEGGQKFVENPDAVHGRLLEAAHIAGYSIARAWAELQWLLEEDRWRRVGGGMEHVNDFLVTVSFEAIRISARSRKGMVRRIKELQSEASQRAIASVVSVSEETVRRDLNRPTNVGNEPVEPAPIEPTQELSPTNVGPEAERERRRDPISPLRRRPGDLQSFPRLR